MLNVTLNNSSELKPVHGLKILAFLNEASDYHNDQIVKGITAYYEIEMVYHEFDKATALMTMSTESYVPESDDGVGFNTPVIYNEDLGKWVETPFNEITSKVYYKKYWYLSLISPQSGYTPNVIESCRINDRIKGYFEVEKLNSAVEQSKDNGRNRIIKRRELSNDLGVSRLKDCLSILGFTFQHKFTKSPAYEHIYLVDERGVSIGRVVIHCGKVSHIKYYGGSIGLDKNGTPLQMALGMLYHQGILINYNEYEAIIERCTELAMKQYSHYNEMRSKAMRLNPKRKRKPIIKPNHFNFMEQALKELYSIEGEYKI